MEQAQILQEERIRTETPEAGLWRAVIELAIVDLSDPDLRESTLKWFMSESNQPMTFRWICVHLDLDSSAVWAALKTRRSWKDPAKLSASVPASNNPRKPKHYRTTVTGLPSRFHPSPR